MRSTALAVHWPSVVRATVLFGLAAILLHLFGAEVGGWAAGSLGPLATLLVGVVAPAWFFVAFPTWFAWRIALPWRLRPLAALACWFSPLVDRNDLASSRVFLAVQSGRPFPAADALPADAWTALAAALQAERQGNLVRTRAIVEALTCLPQESAFPWLARCHGVEALVLAAWARNDWRAVLDYATIGRGRTVRWLGLLARAQLDQRIAPRALWLGWLASAVRLRTAAQLRTALKHASAPPKVTPAPAPSPAPTADPGWVADVRLRHLALLACTARGEQVPAAELLSLARAWEEALGKSAMAQLSARALELDVLDPGQPTQALREAVAGELILLGMACDGPLAIHPDDIGLAGALVSGLREQLCREVEVALAALDPETCGSALHPLEAWERWLGLRAALDHLATHDGRALFALWNGRVAATVWNFTCTVFNRHPRRAAWVAHIMYQWLSEEAELLGDMHTAVVNRENARIALAV